MAKTTPNWQPLTMLSAVANLIDEGLKWAQGHYATLQQAKDKPYVLDDYTINRVFKVVTEQRDDLWVYDEQLTRWQKGHLTPAQRTEIARLQQQMKRWHETVAAILSLAEELKHNTIDKILARDKGELALDVLMGKLKV
jgi:hypothetical protein